MAKISKLKIGQVIYDKHKYKMGNTTLSGWGVWNVFVKEIDPEFNFIIASWNGNPPRKMYQYEVDKYRVKEPKINNETYF